MENLTYILAIIISLCVVVLTIVLGVKNIKKEDVNNSTVFFLTGSAISKNEVIATLVSTNTALALIVFWFSYLGWFYGLGVAFWLSLCWIAGLELFALFQKRWTSFPSPDKDGKMKYQTLHDYISINKGDAARRSLAIVSILSFALMMTVELTRGMRIVDFSTNIISSSNKDIIAFLVLIGAGIYAAYGGLKAIIKTDQVQWFFTFLALITAFVISLKGIIGNEGLFGIVYSPENFSLKSFFLIPSQPYFIIGSLFSWGFWFFVTMDMWQRAAATRKIQIVTNSTRKILYPWFVFLTLASVLIGVFVRVKLEGQFALTFPTVNFLEIIYNGVSGQATLNSVLFIVIFVGFITAMISTLDTYFVSITHSIFRDIPKRSNSGSIAEERFSRFFIAFITIGIGIAIFPIYLLVSHSLFSINALLYLATSTPLILLPPVLLSAGKEKKENGLSLICSVILGLIGSTVTIYYILLQISIAKPEELGQWYNLMYFVPLFAAICSLIGFYLGKIIKHLIG